MLRRASLVWLAAALAGGPLFAAGPAALPGLLERFDHLTVGEAVTVSTLRLAGPHASCELGAGRAAPVRAGEEVVGIFFEGTGAFEYLSADPIEAPVVVFDAKKGSRLKPEKTEAGVRLRDTVKRVLWLARGETLPPLAGAPAPPLADAFRREREKFGRMHAPPLSHDFAMRSLDAPAAPLVWAEIEGGREDLLYVFDGTDDPSEGLATLQASESDEKELRKFLWLSPLSLQPIGRDPRDPPPARYSLTDVGVDLTASAGNDAKLVVEETLVPRGRPAAAFRFDLNSTEYAMAGSNLEARSERVRTVTDEKGRALAFDHRMDQLVVELAEPAPAEKPVRLRFEIDGDFLIRPRGDNYWELGIWPWFPQPTLAGQEYAWHAVVRVPKPFVPFAPGTTVRREEERGLNVLETRVDRPVQFAVVLAGRYDMEEEVRDGVTIRVATYALDNPRGRKQLTKVAAEIIAYYREFLGPFPFSEFNILEINDAGYGQAPPGTMFITKEAFDPLVGDMTPIRGAADREGLRPRDRASVLGRRRPDPEPGGAVAGRVLRGVLRVPLREGPAQRLRRRGPRKALAARGRFRGRRRADPAGQSRLGRLRRGAPGRDPQGTALRQGPDPSRRAASGDGRRGLPRVSEVDAGGARVEVRLDEGDRPAPRGRRRAGPRVVLREVLLGRGDAQELGAGAIILAMREWRNWQTRGT